MKFPFKDQSLYINHMLAKQLNSICYNIKKDWDFVILITGDRTVRTGKSVLAMTVCAYLHYVLNFMKIKTDFALENIFFNSQKAISDALGFPKHSIIMYDEGREALASTKMFTQAQKDILDYFAECGQLNHIFVIVLPDYFNLVEEIAIARSEILLNVYRTETKLESDIFGTGEAMPIVRFGRGRFEFFNRYCKQKLYDKARKLRMKSYGLYKANFVGQFTDQYPVGEAEYRKKKREWLKRFKERKESQMKVRATDVFRDKIVIELHNEGKTSPQIAKWLYDEYKYQITDAGIRMLLRRVVKKKKIGGEVASKSHA